MKKYHAHNSREYRVLLGGNVIDIPEKQNEYGWYYLDSDGDKPIREYVKHVVDDADRAKLLEICYDNWEHFGMYLIEVEEMFDKDPEYYKYQIVDWITWLLYNAIYSAKPTYSEPYFGITIETQDMQEEGEEALYYASTKKMKKSLDVGKMLDELLEVCQQYDPQYADTAMNACYEFSYGDYQSAKLDVDEILQGSDVGKVIALCEDIYGELSHKYNASTKKSYTPDYHDFRTMLTNMKMTKDNRTVFKR